MQIGHRIAQLRTQKNISQKQLAADLNVSTGLVGLWETDKRVPSLECFIALIDYFAISADTLLENDRKLRPEQYQNILNTSSEMQKIYHTFIQLNEDNQDILIGEAKKMLKTQRLEERRNAAPAKKAT